MLTLITTITVALITAVIGPIVVNWVRIKLEKKDDIIEEPKQKPKNKKMPQKKRFVIVEEN